jgi:hypothetical protein
MATSHRKPYADSFRKKVNTSPPSKILQSFRVNSSPRKQSSKKSSLSSALARALFERIY